MRVAPAVLPRALRVRCPSGSVRVRRRDCLCLALIVIVISFRSLHRELLIMTAPAGSTRAGKNDQRVVVVTFLT